MPELHSHSAREFRLEFQVARENALKDAEDFAGIIHVIERLGSFLLGQVAALGYYEQKLTELAVRSSLAFAVPESWRIHHVPFDLLYKVVKDARNDALHVGAYARHLTTHLIELCLIFEDALRVTENEFNHQDNMEAKVSDFMVRTPICAQLWQPMSMIRQVMLTNSFSYLPVRMEDHKWHLVSDLAVAGFLRGCSNNERKRRLAVSLKDAVQKEPTPVVTELVEPVDAVTTIPNALAICDGKPLLVTSPDSGAELVGILTAFDLL